MITGVTIVFISSALAILGLFVDKDGKNFSLIASIFVMFVCALAIFQFFEVRKQEQDQENLYKLLENTNENSGIVADHLTKEITSLPNLLGEKYGLLVDRFGVKNLEELSFQKLKEKKIFESNRLLSDLSNNVPFIERLSLIHISEPTRPY